MRWGCSATCLSAGPPGLFVFAFIACFSFERGRAVRSLGGAALMALAVAFGVGLLFEQLFLVRLP